MKVSILMFEHTWLPFCWINVDITHINEPNTNNSADLESVFMKEQKNYSKKWKALYDINSNGHNLFIHQNIKIYLS